MLQQVGEQIELCRSVLALLPQTWRDFADEILAAVKIALATPDKVETESEREARIVETIENALKRATAQVDGAELEGERARLADLLGPVWTQGLLPLEQQYLAVALRCRGDAVMAKFMPLELGCAVEFTLLERLLVPVRTAHLQHGLELPTVASADGDLGNLLRAYLDAQRTLMLGNLVGMMGKITSRLARNDDAGLFGALAGWLARQPGEASLRAADAETWRRRVARLERLNKRRIAAAHPVPTYDDPTLWADLVEDANDAFFRYFPCAFLPPPRPATDTLFMTVQRR